MQTTVASLILVVSTVVLAGIVVDYAVNVVQAVLQTDTLPGLDRLRDIQNNILNQTDALFNQTLTQTQPIVQSTLTPAPPPAP